MTFSKDEMYYNDDRPMVSKEIMEEITRLLNAGKIYEAKTRFIEELQKRQNPGVAEELDEPTRAYRGRDR